MQDASVQEATQQEVVRRQEKALGEIAEKYAAGTYAFFMQGNEVLRVKLGHSL